MVEYNDNTQLPFEGNDVQSAQDVTGQYICVPANEFGRASQLYALLETIRCAYMTDAYNVSHVVSAVIAALNELEGRSPC